MGLQCKFANSRATNVAQVHFAAETKTTDKVIHLGNEDLHLLIFEVETQLVELLADFNHLLNTSFQGFLDLHYKMSDIKIPHI
ncbi:hypothetical protein FR483_n583R [Paramecium bursaria Chlorella virus FR483]|uniref:Uncharacterized protein n583R n=1 Tax=Paramecium bursaria Chlorella virus FR483 TaxID=399781 RepID=A7J7T7_PBCVF|nr:hypothetical protein FR483_n583R [Paramecium bursaria Chlorella virus FR483]ABT15868.1 hypothetical protein FR483_n583R [Paramecium bursaria Chlorella virus FR483]